LLFCTLVPLSSFALDVLKLTPEINIQPPTPLFSFSPRRLARDVLKSPLETDIQLPAPLTLDDLSWMGIVVK